MTNFKLFYIIRLCSKKAIGDNREFSVEVAGSLGESTELKSQVLWKGISLKMYSWRIQFTGI